MSQTLSRVLLLLCCLPLVVREAVAQEGGLSRDLRRANQQYALEAGASSDASTEAATAAAEAYKAGRLAEAVSAFDSAAASAQQSGAAGSAFEYALAAAELQLRCGEYLDAAARYRRAALGAANDPRAPVAHRSACDAIAYLTESQASQQTVKQYDALLEEHTAAWPGSTFAGEANWRRLELKASISDWPSLIDSCKAIDSTHERYARSRKLLVLAYDGLLGNKDTVQAYLAQATDDLEAIVLGREQRGWPKSWSALQRSAALVLARGHLSRGADGAAYASRMMRVSLSADPRPSPEWEREAAAVLAIAALANEDMQAAEEALLCFEAALPFRRNLLLIAGERLETTHPLGWAEEAERLHAALSPVRSSNSTNRSGIDLSGAQSLAKIGQYEQALSEFRRLAQESPDDRDAQIALARHLSRGPKSDQKAASISAWLAIEKRCAKNTYDWWEARLGRLETMVQLGQYVEARRLLEITLILAPAKLAVEHEAAIRKIQENLLINN